MVRLFCHLDQQSRAGWTASLVACAFLQEEGLCCSVLHAASVRFSAVRRGGAPCFWKGVVCHAYGRERGRDEACLTRLWCTDAQSKGEQAKLTISPDYGYGAKGAAGVRSELTHGLAAPAWIRACLLAAAGLPACDACCSQICAGAWQMLRRGMADARPERRRRRAGHPAQRDAPVRCGAAVVFVAAPWLQAARAPESVPCHMQ